MVRKDPLKNHLYRVTKHPSKNDFMPTNPDLDPKDGQTSEDPTDIDATTDDELDLDDEDVADIEDTPDESADSDDDAGSEDPDDSDEDDKKDWKKIAQTAIAQRNHWKTKAMNNVSERKPAAQKTAKTKQVEDNRVDQERIDFRFDYPGLSRAEVDEVAAYARGKGVSLYDAVKSAPIRAMLKLNQKKKAIAASSVESGHRAQPVKIVKDPSQMSLAELERDAARRVQNSLKKVQR